MAQRISSPVLAGRAAELGRLRSATERAAAGTPVAVVVAGEAGVGKTRLVAELAGEAEAAGMVVLTGGCLDVGDGTLPYAPAAEALRGLTAVLDPAELDGVLGGARAELARLVPELAAPAAAPGPSPGTTPGRLFELLLGVVHRLAARGPALLVVEDLHWADRSTRDLLGFLVRNLRAGVALVLTYRTDELHRRHPLRPFLAELERAGRTDHIELHRLTRRELAELMTGILGRRPAPGLVTDVLARSQGNPFFAEELLAADPDGADLPPVLRDLLLARVEALSEDTQRVLRVAAAAGSRVDHQLLASVTAVSGDRLVELLREAVTRHLLRVDEDGDAYAFRHALVQEALYDDLLPGERSTLHAAYAAALASRGEPAGPAELGQLAYHAYAAHDTGAALLASVRAGMAAEAAFALAEAGEHYGRALELWPQAAEAAASSPLDRSSLLLRAADAALLTGETDRAVALATQALAAVDRAAEPLRASALLERLGRYQWMRGDSRAAMATLEEAVAVVPAEPPSQERARALAAHGQALMLRARNAEAVDRCREAIAAARRVGARGEEGHALTSLGTALDGLGRGEEGVAVVGEGRRIAEELGSPEELCRADYNLTGILIAQGRAETALACALEARQVADRLGSSQVFGAGAVAHAAEALVLLGRWPEAERLLAGELDLDAPAQAGNVTLVQALLVRALLRLWQGDTAGARADLGDARSRADKPLDPQYLSPLATRLAQALTLEGKLDEARRAAAEGLDRLGGCDDERLVVEVCVAGLQVEAAAAELARARRSGQSLDAARQVAIELLGRVQAAGRGPLAGPAAAQSLAAEAEWSRVEGAGDPARWAAAAAAWDALAFPFPAAYARFRQAEALLAADAPRAEAGRVLQPAWSAARDLGARWLAQETGALARRARLDLDPGTPTVEPATSRAQELGLTPREREVLALLADGRTNRQIAQTLFIAEKTASVHVSHILAKLEVANRGEAAAVAHRLGLSGPQATPVPEAVGARDR
jgi:DNA-binding CsgD family transcriptional regulator